MPPGAHKQPSPPESTVEQPAPVRFTDDQINAVFAASHPLPPDRRSAFLEACAIELSRLPEVGDGAVHRVVMQIQRRYFDPPDLGANHRRGVPNARRRVSA
jgi:hypothetical protein